MATRKNSSDTQGSNSSEPKKTTSTKKTTRSYSWKSGIGKSSMKLPDDDLDLKDLGYQERKRYKQDTQQRKLMTIWVTAIISIWLACIIFIVVGNGYDILHYETEVLVALLVTTTANIIALGYIVLKGLFGDVSLK